MGENFGEIVVYDAPEWAKVLNTREKDLGFVKIFSEYSYIDLVLLAKEVWLPWV